MSVEATSMMEKIKIGQGSILFFFSNIMSLYFNNTEKNHEQLKQKKDWSQTVLCIYGKKLLYLPMEKHIL